MSVYFKTIVVDPILTNDVIKTCFFKVYDIIGLRSLFHIIVLNTASCHATPHEMSLFAQKIGPDLKDLK